MRKLEVKQRPRKGYKFRVILCDDQGNAVCDDVNARARIGLAAKRLVPKLTAARAPTQKKEGEEPGEAVPQKTD